MLSLSLIESLQRMPSEFTVLLSLVACYSVIIIATKLFQKDGLYMYNAVSMIVCNIQVLKAMEVSWYNKPIALGTLLYATTFLASDAITELYGAKAARRSIGISFFASISVMILMLLALGLKPINIGSNSEHTHFNDAHNALSIIFSPNAAIVAASLIAYFISQFTDILIFSKLRSYTKDSFLWLRTFISVSVASFLDTVIFSVLAWVVFAQEPITLDTLVFSYILGAYIIQIIVVILNIPAFYLLLKLVRTECIKTSNSKLLPKTVTQMQDMVFTTLRMGLSKLRILSSAQLKLPSKEPQQKTCEENTVK